MTSATTSRQQFKTVTVNDPHQESLFEHADWLFTDDSIDSIDIGIAGQISVTGVRTLKQTLQGRHVTCPLYRNYLDVKPSRLREVPQGCTLSVDPADRRMQIVTMPEGFTLGAGYHCILRAAEYNERMDLDLGDRLWVQIGAYEYVEVDLEDLDDLDGEDDEEQEEEPELLSQ